MWPGLEVGETRPHWENACLGDSLSAGDGHQCIHVESVFGVVMDAEHHHRAAIALNLLSKFECHVGLLSVGLVFDASNRVALDVECESELVALEEIHIAVVNVGNLAELLLVVVFLVDVEYEGERFTEYGVADRLLRVVGRVGARTESKDGKCWEKCLHGRFEMPRARPNVRAEPPPRSTAEGTAPARAAD